MSKTDSNVNKLVNNEITFGVIGGGDIGGGWVARFLLMGFDVNVFDIDPQAQRKIKQMLENARRSMPGLFEYLTVASSASGDTKSFEFFFGRQAQPLGAGACAQDHSVSRVCRAAIGQGRKGTLGQVQRGDDIADNLAAHRAGMCLHADHQIWALHFGITGPIFDLCRGGQLTAWLDALDQNRL